MAKVTVTSLEPDLEEKLNACRQTLRGLERVVVAFSGGADSSFLLALAAETLGKANVLAGMAVSTIFPQRERQAARRLARYFDIELAEINTPQLVDPTFTSNPSDRCYYCKSMILSRLKKLANRRGFPHVVTGTNRDDDQDYRPGSRAEAQLNIRRPLTEAGLTKDEIRRISRAMNLPAWRTPSSGCLVTRIPYGQQISTAKLARIAAAEQALAKLGFGQLRVRDHDTVARIEVLPGQISKAVALREQIAQALRSAGYRYVSLDLEGFRSGAMDEAISDAQPEAPTVPAVLKGSK